MTGARWGIRGLGIVSTVILARLLMPEDFGIVALATMISGAIAIFGEVGLLLHLIRQKDMDRSHFDTVFTLRLMIGTALAAVILCAAPLAGAYFNDARLQPVIQALALTTFLQGLQNPGIALFRKNLDFRKDFWFLFSQKIVSFTTTLILAFLWRDYWALVWGILSGSIAALALSYLMQSFRPRFSLARTSDVWGFSAWILVQQLVDFLGQRLDTLLLGRYRSSTEVGLYTVALDLATSPIAELALPASRVLFPAYAKIADDRAQLASVFGRVFAAMAILAMAMGPGIALVAADAVQVVLGPKWTETIPLIQILAGSAVVYGLAQPINPLLTALGRPHINAYLNLFQLAMLGAAMLPAILFFGMQEVALARGVALTLSLAITILIFIRLTGITGGFVVRSLWRPILAALAMAAMVLAAQACLPAIPLIRLLGAMAVGGAAYGGTLVLLWVLAGRPNTLEADIIILARLDRVFGRPKAERTPPG